jgi:TetR/AcrR family transcriptional repressor of nem operon
MSKAEKTREYIIEKAAPIFNTKGYAGASLNDIIDATGLTKGSIYGNFENKDEVAIAVYQYNVKGFQKRIGEYISAKKTATEKITAIAEYYRENWKKVFERGGCPVLNASIEADDNLPFLKKYIQTSIKNWAESIASIIEQGKENNEFKKNIEAMEYAHTFITLIEGGIMLAKITNNQQHLFNAVDRIVIIMNEELKKK